MDNNIKYGWFDEFNNKHIETMTGFKDKYRTTNLERCLQFGIGTCIEQVEIERLFLEEEGILNKTYTIYCDNKDKMFMHCFLIFYENDMLFLLEHTWDEYKGVSQYTTEEKIFNTVRERFIKKYNLSSNEQIFLVEYEQIPEHLTYKELIEYFNNLKTKEKRISKI